MLSPSVVSTADWVPVNFSTNAIGGELENSAHSHIHNDVNLSRTQEDGTDQYQARVGKPS